jgi:16S rRNA (uracil1498-N3)-methyltransferase
MEKTVELGVDGFLFLDTEYSEASSLDFDKVQSYVLEAVEQSERLSVPIFFSSSSLKNHPLQQERGSALNTWALSDFLQIWQETPVGNVLIARERADTVPILEVLQGLSRQSDEPIMFLVGPEGGWSPAEEEMMDTWEAKCHGRIRSVSLGYTILRSETAAMTAIAAHSLVKSN